MKIAYVGADGKPRGFDQQSGKFTARKDSVAVYEGSATSAELKLQARSSIEYDGCAKVELEIAPSGAAVELQELYLDIPLQAKYATLWHVSEAGLRSNPAGTPPAGEGVVWDSSKTGNGSLLGTFLPYVWLGREEEGVAWFADSDKGWLVDDNAPELQLRRDKNGDTTLRVRFVNHPAKLESPAKLVFGWQASPAKPMPDDFRKPRTGIPPHGGSNRYWGIRPTYGGKYPAEHDYSYADQLLIARHRGTGMPGFLDKWWKTHYADVGQGLLNSIQAHTRGGMAQAASNGRGTALEKRAMMLYFEEHAQDQTTPEWRTFQDEWGTDAFTPRQWCAKIMGKGGEQESVTVVPAASYQDFVLWEAVEWLRRGIGIYCDNCFLRPTTNLAMSPAAYRRPDGNIQPGTGLWEMREYHKRLWVLSRQLRDLTPYPLYISLHMTNANLLPILVWGDINLDIEWDWGGGNLPFPPDLLRAETTGRQTGSYPHALHQCSPTNLYKANVKRDKNAPVVRQEWGIRMTHEIMNWQWGSSGLAAACPLGALVSGFGYGEPTCQVFNYWQDGYPLTVSDTRVKSLALENQGKLLVVLTSWALEPVELAVVPQGALAKFAGMKAFDPETGAAYPEKDGKPLIHLDKWGVRLVQFGGGK